VAGDTTEPGDDVRWRLESRQITVELDEHILRQVLGGRTAAESVERKTEDHRLVVADEGCKSSGVALLRSRERLIQVLGHRERTRHMPAVYT
jgi:hypothetical protein